MASEDKIAIWHSEAMVVNLGKLHEMVREAWCVVVHGVTKSWTWLGS